MSGFWVSTTLVSRWLLLGAPDAGRAVGSGDAARESGRVAGVFLFVRVFRAVGALSAWYSGCIKGASLCRLWKTSL